MHLFYTPFIEEPFHDLDESESRHAVKVIRLRKGDGVILVDGKGTWCEACIVDDNPGKCRLKILSKTENHAPLPYHLHIGIPLLKNMERFEWFLEKATEIGISEITPILCTHSERFKLKTDRMERIIISAMKQSQRAFKPILHPLTPFTNWIRSPYHGTKAIGFIDEFYQTCLWDVPLKNGLLMAIGPEGDFTSEEVTQAVKQNFLPVSLGRSRLRSETAGLLTCSVARIRFMKQ
ncbi:MAG: 16S rRNA (uracil(1498)-N(3))-methyltransferase [Bacteroidales bacterium]|nr:16S rRNA (uracil(1498)-N(3))-methyltransferase [Bacteroidales bacterium]MBN2697272.1 16S rRNA (uracil(1498)-N(3))-methyltransferase [Bacteroidales bacterium]